MKRIPNLLRAMARYQALLVQGALVISLWVVAQSARAQTACSGAQNLRATDITATTATIAFEYPPAYIRVCRITMGYSYDGGPLLLLNFPISAVNISPVKLTGLVAGKTYKLYLSRRCSLDPLPTFCGPSSTAADPTIEFTMASALATQAASEAGNLTIAPNPTATGRTTLTLGTPLAHAQPVYVHDALGRLAQQLVVPAAAKGAELSLTGLPAGVYVVRCGSTAQRLVVE